MKVLAGLLLLFSAHAFAANTAVYKVVIVSKTAVSMPGAAVENVNDAKPIEVALSSEGYGEYIDQQAIHGRTLYRTLIVADGNKPNCHLTATVLWDNGDSITREETCAQLNKDKALTLQVADTKDGREYATAYTVYSEE